MEAVFLLRRYADKSITLALLPHHFEAIRGDRREHIGTDCGEGKVRRACPGDARCVCVRAVLSGCGGVDAGAWMQRRLEWMMGGRLDLREASFSTAIFGEGLSGPVPLRLYRR